MKASKTIFNFNHIDNNLTEAEISECKALYKYYHRKYWLFKITYKYFKKILSLSMHAWRNNSQEKQMVLQFSESELSAS